MGDGVGTAPAASWQKPVGISDHKFEGHFLGSRAKRAELAFAFPASPQQHKVDHIGDIDVLRSVKERIGSTYQATCLIPKVGRAVIMFTGLEFRARVVGADGIVVFFFAAKVVGCHFGVPAFTEVILPPVLTVEIDMNEAPVRRNLAHLEHRVIDEAGGHIASAS